MSLLSNLKPKAGSTHYGKRIGRGIGSGMGGTSTKGHKGQLARTGGTVRRGFEGGQTPLSRRLPKFGFTNAAFANEFQIINLSDLNKFQGDVDAAVLHKAGLVTKSARVKVLAKGELTKAVTVKAHAFSEKAKAAIEKAGGKIEVIK
ncbi:50S ribosomal protein L15 [Pseudobdellovibrio exovorus]|uniref:Large ribosomal subunit protein uL15 n=1 Tax=Pseudobdellovibrio exovorus JSS TaxID=1184267 RepID=M4VSD5_9BACT|nr:50S ribosomal protein L15 [Pseudobdellovibrio exovorus]AGH96109.1 50S ribosomal protein L15 [Pseudobdellovibrio exovorus JSS]